MGKGIMKTLLAFLILFPTLCLAQVNVYDVRGRLVDTVEREDLVPTMVLADGVYFVNSPEKIEKIIVSNAKIIRTVPNHRPVVFPDTQIPVYVDKGGWVELGLPFQKGIFRPRFNLAVRKGEIQLAYSEHEKLMFWPERSVKMARLTFYAPEAGEYEVVVTRLKYSLELDRKAEPGIFSFALNGETVDPAYDDGVSKTRVGDILLTVYSKWYPDASTRSWIMVTNKTPCNTRAEWPGGSQWQPGCAEYGGPADRAVELSVATSGPLLRLRYATEIGLPDTGALLSLMDGQGQLGTLRAGESRAWEITTGQEAEPPLALASATYYASTELFPLVPYARQGVRVGYEDNMVAGIAHIYDDRTSRSWWANSRDFGEDYRDWDTPSGENWGTHNDEFEANLGFLLQALRSAGTVQDVLGRKSFRLAESGAVHHAVVDVNAISVGESHPNIRWVGGSNWQHTNHGDRGHYDAHRSEFSPHLSHANGRACLWMGAFTANPLMLEGFKWISENVHWRIETDTHPDLDGELRIAANSLGIVLDAYELNMYRERSILVAREIITQASNRTYLIDHTNGKAKPWMCSLFVVQLLRARDLVPELRDLCESLYPSWASFLADYCVTVDGRGNTSMWYKVNPMEDSGANMWDLVGADALVEWNPELALRLFQSGGNYPWYGGHPTGEYGTLLAHTVLNGYGHKTMKVLGL
jgi:hypothetical protein